MARPQEGLGDAFSCRLREDQDKLAREERSATNKPLSQIVRDWVDRSFRLQEENDYLRARITSRSKQKDRQYGLIQPDATDGEF